MAERRMFSKKIIDSDEFLDLPLNAQCLYFHLSIQADDDGFVGSHKKILRSIGAGECDMELLIKRKFIIAFDSGIVAIRHWKVHNYIAKDRYRATMFLEEKKKLSCDENGAYVEDKDAVYNSYTNCIQPVDNPYTNCIQPVYKVYTQDSIGKDSIDKDSLGKGSVGKESIEKERIEKFSLGEGSINTPPPPYENKYEEDFSSEWAVAPFPTGKCLHEVKPRWLEEQHHYEESRLPEEQHHSPDDDISSDTLSRYSIDGDLSPGTSSLYPTEGDGYMPQAFNMRSAREDNGEGALKPVEGAYGRIAFPSGGRGTASAVDEVLSGKYDETENAVLKPIEDPYSRIAFPSGGRGTASAVDEVLSGKYDKTENAVLKPVEGAYGRGIVRLTDGQLADLKERLGENQLNRYMDKLASFITDRGARIRSHYDTLLKWYEEDFKNQSATAKPLAATPSNRLAYLPPEKPRYGSFDPTEAFMAALARSQREIESELDSNQ